MQQASPLEKILVEIFFTLKKNKKEKGKKN
jgi:hypothetical protein